MTWHFRSDSFDIKIDLNRRSEDNVIVGQDILNLKITYDSNV